VFQATARVGLAVGLSVGPVVGKAVGATVGKVVGLAVGEVVGLTVGSRVGSVVLSAIGAGVGTVVGSAVGAVVGLEGGVLINDMLYEKLNKSMLCADTLIPDIGVADKENRFLELFSEVVPPDTTTTDWIDTNEGNWKED
jgi:outer membrane lipoprotein SlyB